MAGAKFDDALREVLFKRDDLENEVANALDSASSASELDRLRKQVVKISQYYGKFDDEIQKKMLTLGFSSAPSAGSDKNTVKPVQDEKSTAGQTNPTSYALDNQKSATDKAVVKQVMIKTERTTEETPVIDFSKIRVPARSAVSKTDWQTLKEANNTQVYFPQLNPETSEASLRQGLLDLGYKPLKIEMATWKGGKTRGSATVTLRKAEEVEELVGRKDIEIDGWSVSPKILLADQMMSESNTSSESGSEQTEDGTKADDKKNDTIVASADAAIAKESVSETNVDIQEETGEKAEVEEGTAAMSKKQRKAAKKAAASSAKLEKVDAEPASGESLPKLEAIAKPVPQPKKEVSIEGNPAKDDGKVEKKEKTAEDQKPSTNGTTKKVEKKQEAKSSEPGQLESILTNGFIPSTHHVMGYLLERIKWGMDDVKQPE